MRLPAYCRCKGRWRSARQNHLQVASLEITGEPDDQVTDRPGHDRRYTLSSAKLSTESLWSPPKDFERVSKATLDCYRRHDQWVRDVKSGEYQSYYARNYDHRELPPR